MSDLNSDEVKQAIKDAVEEATNALAAKNKELLGELKEARKGKQIDPAELEKLEAQIDTLKGELTTAQRAVKDASTKAETATKQLETEKGFTQKLLVDNGLSDVLVKAGVSNPAMLKAVKSMLASQVQIVADGDNRIAKVGEKALDEFVKEWSASDEGKHFITAQNNTGGGSNGGGGNGAPSKGKLDGNDKERAEYFASKFKLNETT